jgi:hypothetical protein
VKIDTRPDVRPDFCDPRKPAERGRDGIAAVNVASSKYQDDSKSLTPLATKAASCGGPNGLPAR